MTASISLQINGAVKRIIYLQDSFERRLAIYANPLRILRQDASSSLVSGWREYPRLWRDNPVMHFNYGAVKRIIYLRGSFEKRLAN